MLKVAIVVGNPKPQSRTLRVAEAAADALLRDTPHDRRVVDLADYAARVFAWPSSEMAELNRDVAGSDLLVVASPTYKATYTGLLKGFLDRYSAGSLRGVVAVPVMTGADLGHAMGPDTHLRPLLIELGASVPWRSLYFVTAQMDQMPEIVAEWGREVTDALARQRRVLDAIAGLAS